MEKVLGYATELSKQKLHELIVPTIQFYQRWVNELAALAISVGGSSAPAKVERIEKKVVAAMKPTARKLAIYEAYSELESNHAYTEAIGLVHRANDLPPEFDSNVKAIFSINKPFVDIYNDQKLKVAKD